MPNFKFSILILFVLLFGQAQRVDAIVVPKQPTDTLSITPTTLKVENTTIVSKIKASFKQKLKEKRSKYKFLPSALDTGFGVFMLVLAVIFALVAIIILVVSGFQYGYVTSQDGLAALLWGLFSLGSALIAIIVG
jgi:hypothetical protein